MKRNKIIRFLLVLFIVAAAGYGYTEYNRKNKDLMQVEPEVYVTTAALLTAYEKDSTAFHEKYTDKVIAVSGRVKRIDAGENPVVITLGNDSSLSSVQCSMDTAYATRFKTLQEGQQVTIKGICAGGRTDDIFGTDVILNRSVEEIKK